MRIVFVVNDVDTETFRYTSTRLGLAALRRGHDVWTVGVGDFTYGPDDTLRAHARRPSGSGYKTEETYLRALQGDEALQESLTVGDLDVLMLRNDPAEDQARPWAQSAGVAFGEIAAASGAIVLNDPTTLSSAMTKTYFQRFPQEVRPRTIITRDPADVRRFQEEQDGDVVLKPLQGSGGQSVFLLRKDDRANLNQMVDAIERDGYVVAQEYLPAARDGDVRLFLMNGSPLERDGHFAAFRRVNTSGDMRSNMHVGGKSMKAKVTDEMLSLADAVRPRLVQDGMFLVGIDIVGDKLMEVNVFSPGGLGSVKTLTDQDFSPVVIEAIEHKVEYRRRAGGALDNRTLACL